MSVFPVTHDLIHMVTVDTARLPLNLLDEVTEAGARRGRSLKTGVDGEVRHDWVVI